MTREEELDWLYRLKSNIYVYMPKEWLIPMNNALDAAIKALEQEPNTWSLDDAREDFTSDVYNTLDFLPTNNEANRIIDSFDRVTSSIKYEPKTGHWIKGKYKDDDIRYNDTSYKCDKCGKIVDFKENYCPNCGAKMAESENP